MQLPADGSSIRLIILVGRELRCWSHQENLGKKPSKVECSIFQLQLGVQKCFIKTTSKFLLNISVISFNLTLESRGIIFEFCSSLVVVVSKWTWSPFRLQKNLLKSVTPHFNVMRWGARERIVFPSLQFEILLQWILHYTSILAVLERFNWICRFKCIITWSVFPRELDNFPYKSRTTVYSI